MKRRDVHLREGQPEKARHLLQLHVQPRILELHNVWDVTSTRAIARHPGTTAIATASAAIAASHGYDDGEHIPWALHLACLERICSCTELPVTADIERGYGDPVGTVLDVVAAGGVGVNLEDALRPVAEFAAELAAVRAVTEELGLHVIINARTDEFLLAPEPSLGRAIAAAHAYRDTGADCVFIPGMIERDDIQTMVREIGPGCISLLNLPGLPTPSELQRLGVARVSHGPALHRATEMFVEHWPAK